MNDIAALRALSQAATPGPWRVESEGDQVLGIYGPERYEDYGTGPERADVQIVETDCGHYPPEMANARYIAALSPSTALALLDEIDRLRALLGEACELADLDEMERLASRVMRDMEHPPNSNGIPSPDMAQLPTAVEQFLRVHASFIHSVVDALRDRSQLPELMKQLDAAEQAGWVRLVGALRHVINGRRDPSIKLGLDEEDAILLDAILRGFDNPATLPPLNAQPDGSGAAPGLAALIDASARGDAQAMSVLANMAEQMMKAGGDMALLGGRIRRLVNGERDADQLIAGMGPLGRELLISLLDELAKLRPQ